MPCSPVIAHLLLKQEKAQVKHQTPFTIKLLYKTRTEYIQPLVLGIDPGSRKLGSAVVDIEHRNVFYMSQVELRDDITRKMNRRAKYRRNRRTRKTRYRKPRSN
ncbi:MAG: RRXRR domain-containing protein [Promethearchaeota archaeon]